MTQVVADRHTSFLGYRLDSTWNRLWSASGHLWLSFWCSIVPSAMVSQFAYHVSVARFMIVVQETRRSVCTFHSSIQFPHPNTPITTQIFPHIFKLCIELLIIYSMVKCLLGISTIQTGNFASRFGQRISYVRIFLFPKQPHFPKRKTRLLVKKREGEQAKAPAPKYNVLPNSLELYNG